MRKLSVASAITVLVAGAALASAGSIELPARELMDFEEGTIEAWVMFEFNPEGWQEDEGVYQWRGRWFTFIAPQTETDLGAKVVIEYGLKNHGRLGRIEPGCNFRTAFYHDGQKVPHPLLPACTKMARGSWHHYAITWSGGRFVRAYLDGELAQELEFPYSVMRDIPAEARIIIGHPEISGFNLIAIDDLRISSVARSAQELGFHHAPLQPDPHTLLMMSFDAMAEGEGGLEVTPEVIADLGAPESYQAGAGRIIEGRHGQAWALTTTPPEGM